MMIYYVSNNNFNKYTPGVYTVLSAILPHENISRSTLEEQYDIVVSSDSLTDTICGYPDKLVIDTTSEVDIVVREKNELEYTIDAKITKIDELKIYTHDLIISVADDSKQRSLTILYSNMDTVQKTNYELYQSWHNNVLTEYFNVKSDINSCSNRTELNNINFDTEFSTLISNKPEISLSDFI